jgi:hypothetical protein
MRAQPGFFDVDDRMKRLSDLGGQLEAFGSAVDFEIFRGGLVSPLAWRGSLAPAAGLLRKLLQ